MCHRLGGLSTNGLKAHVREISTPPKLTFEHSTPLLLRDDQALVNLGDCLNTKLVQM